MLNIIWDMLLRFELNSVCYTVTQIMEKVTMIIDVTSKLHKFIVDH